MLMTNYKQSKILTKNQKIMKNLNSKLLKNNVINKNKMAKTVGGVEWTTWTHQTVGDNRMDVIIDDVKYWTVADLP